MDPSQNSTRPVSGLTWRGLLLGLGCVLLISLGAPYSIWMVGSSEITWSYFPVGVGVPFLLIALALGVVFSSRFIRL